MSVRVELDPSEKEEEDPNVLLPLRVRNVLVPIVTPEELVMVLLPERIVVPAPAKVHAPDPLMLPPRVMLPPDWALLTTRADDELFVIARLIVSFVAALLVIPPVSAMALPVIVKAFAFV